MSNATAPKLSPQVCGWLRHLWRKTMTPDDWSRGGEPHPWWDRYSLAPMFSFARFDLSESSSTCLLVARKTPAWREVYAKILDQLIRRHTTYWAAVDWLTQIGPDPDRARYPRAYRRLIPKDLWGNYDAPGWTANGIEPWGLQADPVGSSGNLFFRGFLTLMLAIHRAVTGESTWDRPFEVTGLDDRTFPWTHRGIAEYLSNQWATRPQGPHCENTKSWPYCLSAAGLGLQLTDATLGTRTHWVYDRWVEDVFTKKLMRFDRRGRLEGVALYYDPILDRVHEGHRIVGLFPSIYAAPQNRELGEQLYRNAVASVGWDRWYLPVLSPVRDPRPLTLGYLMAREYGDHTTARRLGNKLAKVAHARFFDAEGGNNEDEFGHFFRYGEPYPRGQESALYLLKDLLDGEGAWWRAFNDTDRAKFHAPTVTDAEYPKMGFSVAWNDEVRGALDLHSYTATSSAAGDATRFSVRQIPDPALVHVRRDGRNYGAWRTTGPDSIEIETTVGPHAFEIVTGYAGPNAATAGERRVSATPPLAAASRTTDARTTLADYATALSTLGRGAAACPCCAGPA